MARRQSGPFPIAAALLVLTARASAGQAYIPSAGDGTVSVSFQSVHTSSQSDVNGVKGDPETTDTRAVLWQVEYGLTERIAVHASLPLIFGRYEGLNPHTVGRNLQPSDLDNGTYHGGFQDFYVGVRYGLGTVARPRCLPVRRSHYPEPPLRDPRAVGRRARPASAAASDLPSADSWTASRPVFITRPGFRTGLRRRLSTFCTNRTGIDSAVGYFVNPRFAVQFVQTMQYIHNGMFFVFEPEFDAGISGGGTVTDQHFIDHDRLLRSRVVTLGGGVTYSLTDSIGLFATATSMAWGRSLPRPVRSFSVGMNWGFKAGRSASRANPTVSRPPAFQ